jgi:hypothetical protein
MKSLAVATLAVELIQVAPAVSRVAATKMVRTVATRIVSVVATAHTRQPVMRLRARRHVQKNVAKVNTSVHRVSAIAPRAENRLLTKQFVN